MEVADANGRERPNCTLEKMHFSDYANPEFEPMATHTAVQNVTDRATDPGPMERVTMRLSQWNYGERLAFRMFLLSTLW